MVMRITRLSDGPHGLSQFSDETLALQAATGNGASASATSTDSATALQELQTELPIRALRFLQLQPGWSREQSPAPDERYLLVLNGVLDIEAGDGEMRRFGPGSTLLITDTTGSGHRARVIGGPALLAVAPLHPPTQHAADDTRATTDTGQDEETSA